PSRPRVFVVASRPWPVSIVTVVLAKLHRKTAPPRVR
ncbi:MAG: hypothetical protein JWM76_3300, partial [Pseudonocardiales bacterium]|nr:hypothetical protein [Pseudonocardiales bacterium]